MKKLIFLFSLCLFFEFCLAQERILEFQTDVVVNMNRSLEVTETIVVKAEGNQIQRGIFRDIPTVLTGTSGRQKKYNLVVNEILKNGIRENFDVESNSDGVRIRIGSADIFLNPDVYTYTIKYTIDRQVRFFDAYDEIYWNATGNLWEFTIEKSTATVILPEGADILQFAAYSGPQGETECACTVEKLSGHQIKFSMTQPLYSYEGMTVSVAWNKGVVPPPTVKELKEEMIEDNMGIIYGATGLLVILLYLFIVWLRIGRDPKTGTIIPLFEPPNNFSPAACRYIMEMGYDPKAFTSSIVNMAVKGHLTIDKSTKYFRLLRSTTPSAELSAEEKKISAHLTSKKAVVELDKSYDSSLATAKTKHEETLEKEFKKTNFRLNYGWMVPAILLGIATFLMMMSEVINRGELAFFAIIGCIILAISMMILYNAVQTIMKPGILKKIVGIILLVVFLSIIISWINYAVTEWGAEEIILLAGPYWGIFLMMVISIMVFFYLIKAPTLSGRKSMDEIAGLKLFMTVAEKDRLNMLNPPEKTPQLFEKLLPYAIALNVENEWGDQFNDIIAKAIENKEYTPRWYNGPSDQMFNVNTISTSIGSSLSSAVSSGSTPPSSSSSGSSGGGSSGGGGGGGGGGGW